MQQVVTHRVEGILHQRGAVHEADQLNPGRDLLLDLGDALFDPLRHRAAVLTHQHHGDSGDRLPLSILGDAALPGGGSELHLRHVTDEHERAPLGFEDDVAKVVEVLNHAEALNDLLLVLLGDIAAAGVAVVLLQCLAHVGERQVVRAQSLGVGEHLILFDVAAEAVDLDDAGHCPQAGLHLPIQDRPPLHERVVLAFDEHIVDLAETRRNGRERGRLDPGRQLLPHVLEPLVHELAGEVDARVVGEDHRDLRQAELRDGAQVLRVRKAGKCDLDGRSDLPLHLLRPKRRGCRVDDHLLHGDVRHGVNGQVDGGVEPDADQQQRGEDHQRPVADGEVDEAVHHRRHPPSREVLTRRGAACAAAPTLVPKGPRGSSPAASALGSSAAHAMA